MGTRSNHKRIAAIGPGGMNCACCGPAPGATRKAAKRNWKRRERQISSRELALELSPAEPDESLDDPGDDLEFESEFEVDFDAQNGFRV